MKFKLYIIQRIKYVKVLFMNFKHININLYLTDILYYVL